MTLGSIMTYNSGAGPPALKHIDAPKRPNEASDALISRSGLLFRIAELFQDFRLRLVQRDADQGPGVACLSSGRDRGVQLELGVDESLACTDDAPEVLSAPRRLRFGAHRGESSLIVAHRFEATPPVDLAPSCQRIPARSWCGCPAS